MGERNMSIVFSSGISELTERNSSFDSGVLRVCYVGRNRNNSFISKETFERCMPSIYNCPIVCRYERETDSIGAHDMELVSSDKGMKIVNVTTPVGIVPESSRVWFEEIEDESGIHEYLCVDALLWKRQEAYQKIKEDGITDESMEITVKEGHMSDGVYVIDRFEFTAFCLLGSAEPCYESASLEMFSLNDFKAQLAEMMREYKESFSIATANADDDKSQEFSEEGGDKALEQKIALMTQYGLTEEQLDFKLEDFSIEELEAKFEEMKPAEEPVENPEEQFALAEQFTRELIDALHSEMIETCFGEMPRYIYFDYDTEKNEVYCTDCEDWKMYGFSYIMNGDNVVIDFESKKRVKIAIVDFDEGEQVSGFGSMFAVASEKFSQNNDEWEQKFQTASDTIESMKNELESLRKFKTDAEDAAAEAARNEVFARFEDLVGVEAFENLRGDCEQYSVEDLEEKCFAIRGRVGTVEKFSVKGEPGKATKLPVDTEPKKTAVYGGVFEKYGFVPNK